MGRFSKLNDKELVLRFNNGDSLAFDEMYLRYWKRVYTYTFNIIRDKELTEDVLQDVFTKLWVKREELEIQSLKSYLFNAARNTAISQLRKIKFTDLHDILIEKLTLDHEGENSMLVDDVRQAIDDATQQLPKRCREIFYMSRFEHLSNQEISEKLGISIRSVENQLSIALKHLRPILQKSMLLLMFYQL